MEVSAGFQGTMRQWPSLKEADGKSGNISLLDPPPMHGGKSPRQNISLD